MFRRRRLRSSEYMRALVRETSVGVDDLIYPIFVVEGENQKNPIGSMPGIYQYSIDRIDEELDRIREVIHRPCREVIEPRQTAKRLQKLFDRVYDGEVHL